MGSLRSLHTDALIRGSSGGIGLRNGRVLSFKEVKTCKLPQTSRLDSVCSAGSPILRRSLHWMSGLCDLKSHAKKYTTGQKNLYLSSSLSTSKVTETTKDIPSSQNLDHISGQNLKMDEPHSHSHGGTISHDSNEQVNTNDQINHNDHNSHSHSHAQAHSHSHSDDHAHTHSLLHSHSHGPNELLSKGFTTNPAVRITWIGLLVNVGMAGTKAVGGVYFHSQALIADAIHSLSDMIADFLTLATVNVSLKEGSPTRFPLGYGKIESVGTFLVSGVLLFAGFTVGWSSLLQIFEYVLPSHIYDYLLVLQVHSHSHSFGAEAHTGHSHSHSHAPVAEADVQVTKQPPNINAAWLALASIGVKELLYKQTMKVALATHSKVLVANAWHHRVDSLTAAVAFLTVTSGYLFGVVWLDAVGGLLVSMLIIHAGFGTFKDAWFELVDRGVPEKAEQYANVKLMIEEEMENVANVTGNQLLVVDLSVLNAGARSNVVVKLRTPQNLSLETMNKLEFDLLSLLRSKDRHLGRVFVQYELQKDFKSSSAKTDA